MRLPRPFTRLPLLVDADRLALEVDALDESSWRRHPQGNPGNSAVPLVAVNGDPDDDGTVGSMEPTAFLASLPYLRQVLAALDTVVGRSRLMRIAEEGSLARHVDTNYYWWEHLRVHLPVRTAPEVTFECGDEAVHMGAGECWVFDTWKRHRVLNPASAPRIHLVVDTVGSDSLWRRIDDPLGTPVQSVPFVDTADPELTFEQHNHPVVMTPWELDSIVTELGRELAEVDEAAAQELHKTLLPLLRGWRATWARHGDHPEGWPRFERLLHEADRAVDPLVDRFRLPNDVEVTTAFRQLVVRPAFHPELVEASPRPARRAKPRAGAPSVPALDRPIFIVSSPRAGSSLLFETLARAPGVSTIGGESHRVIEGIPALHPAAHDWASNRLDESDAEPAVVGELTAAFIAQARDRDGLSPAGPGVRLLEKTPKNSLRVPFLAAAYPDARFVYLYRDPRETVSSMLDAWRSGRFVTYRNLPGWQGADWSLVLTPGWRELSGRTLPEVVASQWATATTVLLDDLEALELDRWCVASYDRLVGDPQAEIDRLCAFVELDWDGALQAPLPLSKHTLDQPDPEKWRRNADALEPVWEGVRDAASRAHAVFGTPPAIVPAKGPRPRAATAAPRRRSGGHTVPATEAPGPAAGDADVAPFRSVHTATLPGLLADLRSSLLVTTYQSGRVIAVRARDGELNTHFRFFARPMGLARRGNDLAIGVKAGVWRYRNQPAVAPSIEPAGTHDAAFMPRRFHVTGDIRIHDLAFAGDELWVVNTRFSCLATLDEQHSFVPRWRPPFITRLAAEDRCHLNGLAVVDGEVRYVTALGISDDANGWREHKADGGVVLDVTSGAVVAADLSMPHSPRWYGGRLFVLESGIGSLGVVDLERGTVDTLIQLPGFTRGLAFSGKYAVVGLSQVREQIFRDIPLTEGNPDRLCGVWVVDLERAEVAAFLRFEGSVQEIFDVQVLPGATWPEIAEPDADVVGSAFVLPDAAMTELRAGGARQ